MADSLNNKNRDVEVLRCLAIIFTITHHISLTFPNSQWWKDSVGDSLGLWTGVDLFFVVSGFVITQTLLPLVRQPLQKRKVLYGFWVKRAYRLLPTAWLWLLLPVLVSALSPSISVSQVFQGALAGILQLSNLYFALCTHKNILFTECTSLYVSAHYWSLSLEEQFYIVLPIVLLLVPSKRLIKFIVLAIVLIFFWDRPIHSFGWYFRVDGFLWGVPISLFAHNYPKTYLNLRPAVLDTSFVRITCCLFFIALLGLAPKIHALSSVAAIAVICAVLVFLASYNRGYTFGNSQFSNAMVAVGARSYSLYVIHVPVFFFTSNTISKLTTGFDNIVLINLLSFLASMSLLVGFAELNYRCLEIPIRDKGRKIAKQMIETR